MIILKEIQYEIKELAKRNIIPTILICNEKVLEELRNYPAEDIQHEGCFYGLNIELDNKIKRFILK